jgi:hypothetical protein
MGNGLKRAADAARATQISCSVTRDEHHPTSGTFNLSAYGSGHWSITLGNGWYNIYVHYDATGRALQRVPRQAVLAALRERRWIPAL